MMPIIKIYIPVRIAQLDRVCGLSNLDRAKD